MALQGYPRSLTLAPIESPYAISYWSSIVTLDVEFTSYGAFKQSLTGVILIKFFKVYFM